MSRLSAARKMATLKDDIADDISTFVRASEFADLTWIDGVLLPCVVDEKTAEQSARQNETYAGLHGDYVTIYFPTAPYVKKRERVPRNGEWVTVGSKRYDVVSSRDEHGITILICSAYRQNILREKPFGNVDPYGELL